MFRNSKGELVPHCGDCIHGNPAFECPDNALMDSIDDERGVVDCPAFMPRENEVKADPSGRGR
jgi:hypothetical protein